MKRREYVKPLIEVMQVEPEALMAASGGENTVKVGFDDEETYSGVFRAKGHSSSVWDFGDEDED